MTEVDTKSSPPPIGDHPPAPEPNDANNPEQDSTNFPPQGPSGQPFPPPNFGFYNYPPGQAAPPSGEGGNPDSNGQPQQNGAPQGPNPYPPPPPGMMFSYPYPQPPPGYMPVSMAGMPLPGALVKPKRKQVKMACTNCAMACKRCDVARPCERCVKYGLSESCRDGVRKERKKGFKRGPYNKRKRPEEREAHEWEAAHNNPNGEWTPGPPGAPFQGTPQQAGFPPPPEGYYPAFYALAPPGPGPQLVPVVQPGHPNEHHVEGQTDGNADPNAHPQGGDQSQVPQGQPGFPPPHAQFVYPPMPPGSYAPFGYPFPNPAQQQPPPPPPPQQQQQQQQPEASASASAPGPAKRVAAETELKEEDDEEDPPTPPRKRRGRRNSDGEWPGASKRTAKTKVENATPTRRSTRRQQSQSEPSAAGGEDGGTNPVENNGGTQPAPGEDTTQQQQIDESILAESSVGM